MWDAVAPVGQTYDPIISESPFPMQAIVMNAGPGIIKLRAWDIRTPNAADHPDSEIELRPGDTRAVAGSLIRVRLFQIDNNFQRSPDFAAVGWRISRSPGWLP
jgi:hypothetical protein